MQTKLIYTSSMTQFRRSVTQSLLLQPYRALLPLLSPRSPSTFPLILPSASTRTANISCSPRLPPPGSLQLSCPLRFVATQSGCLLTSVSSPPSPLVKPTQPPFDVPESSSIEWTNLPQTAKPCGHQLNLLVAEVPLYKRARYIPTHAGCLRNSKAEIANCTGFLPAKVRHPSPFDVRNSKAGGIKHDSDMDSNSEIMIKEVRFSQIDHFPYVAILLLSGLPQSRDALLKLLV